MAFIHYEGSQCFKLRILLSTISRKNIVISNIRSNSDHPGLKTHEISLLRLIDKITDGTKLSVDPTGSKLTYNPGILIGIEPDLAPIQYSCSNNKSITYYLEALALLAPFCKYPVDIKLTGVTHTHGDPSVDCFRLTTLPILKTFGASQDISLKIIKRGSCPSGGGEVKFYCPPIRTLKPIKWLQKGRVKRVRGVAYSNKVSNNFSLKIIDTVRGVLNDFLPDVWIYNDNCSTEHGGNSPGFGISLSAETYKNSFKCADVFFDNDSSLYEQLNKYENPFNANINETLNILSTDANKTSTLNESEDVYSSYELELLGRTIAWKLLQEIKLQGVVDSSHQHIPLLFMALGEEHTISEIKISSLTPYTLQLFRHLQDFLGSKFELSRGNDNDRGGIICRCIGSGYKNLATKTY